MTHEQVAHRIDNEFKLLTTAQKLHTLRKRYTDAYLLDCLPHCSRGNRDALSTLLNKHTIKYRDPIERPYDPNQDIANEMLGRE